MEDPLLPSKLHIASCTSPDCLCIDRSRTRIRHWNIAQYRRIFGHNYNPTRHHQTCTHRARARSSRTGSVRDGRARSSRTGSVRGGRARTSRTTGIHPHQTQRKHGHLCVPRRVHATELLRLGLQINIEGPLHGLVRPAPCTASGAGATGTSGAGAAGASGAGAPAPSFLSSLEWCRRGTQRSAVTRAVQNTWAEGAHMV